MIKPLVSVVIPVYNRPEALKKTLESVIIQTYANLEILVIDDGSDVEIYPIIEELNDNRISYFRLEHNNANVARNYGIEYSKGKYIAMLDADDLWLENHIESCFDFIQKEQTDGIYGSLILRDIFSKKEHIATVRPLRENETMIDYLLSLGYGAQTSTLFMTRESVKKVSWNPELNRHQDYDFVIRYSKQYNFSAKVEPTAIYVFDKSKRIKIDFESCMRVIEENENDITPNLYMNYHLQMLSLAKSQNASSEIIKYYQKEATCYKELISLYQFLTIRQPQTEEELLKCRQEYVSYISEIPIE